MYPLMVRPHLVSCTQLRSPHLKKDVVEMAEVQRRANPYEERLFILEKRRMIEGGMIETCKMLHG